MKNTIIAVSILLVTACGSHREEPTCSVTKVDDISTITCPDGTVTNIQDGVDGSDGLSGAPGQVGVGIQGPVGPQGPSGAPGTIVTVVPLCPNLPGVYPEVLLRINGLLYAFLEGGNNLGRLVYVGPGSYSSSDGRACSFTVDTNNQVL